MNTFNGDFEVYNLEVRRTSQAAFQRVVLEATHSLELEREIIEFRADDVKAKLTYSDLDTGKQQSVEFVSNVKEIKVRLLKEDDKIRIVLQAQYDKEKEPELVSLRFKDVAITLERIENQLDFDGPVDSDIIPDFEVEE